MKKLEYTDSAGRLQWSIVRDEGDDPAEGIPCGIPDLGDLGVQREVEIALHNGLARAGLFTRQDVGRQQNAITSIVRKVAREFNLSEETAGTIRRQIIGLYRLRR